MADLNVPDGLSSGGAGGGAGGLDPSMDLRGKKGSKVPLIVIGVLVLGGIGFFVFRSMKTRDDRKRHADFMSEFAKVEKEEVGKFWNCVLGANVDAGAFPDNLVLTAKVTSQFAIDPKNYPGRVSQECTQKALDARNKALALTGPSEYTEPLQLYGAALKQIVGGLEAWAKVAPEQVQDMQAAKKLGECSTAYHAFAGGKPEPDVINYDAFMRCAVPTIDTMKDKQALLELLFKECKKPAFTSKLVDACDKTLLADPAPAPAKTLVKLHAVMAGDERDHDAFDDCMRRGRKGKRRDDLAEVGKGWLSWQEAGRKIRGIGKEALKD